MPPILAMVARRSRSVPSRQIYHIFFTWIFCPSSHRVIWFGSMMIRMQTFGTIAADQSFTLSIGIDVHGSTATATVTLVGPGVSNDSFKENI